MFYLSNSELQFRREPWEGGRGGNARFNTSTQLSRTDGWTDMSATKRIVIGKNVSTKVVNEETGKI